MKTAKEMFEELGYKEVRNNKYFLDYEHSNRNSIVFSLQCKTFYKIEYGCDCGDITIQELKAINKQISELGW